MANVRVFCFPTILVAEEDGGLREVLVRNLQQQGYLVLEASDGAEALDIARVHSRRIHLMLTDGDADGRTLAATLKQYRPDMQVLFVTRHAKESVRDLLAPDQALNRVRELVEPPRRDMAEQGIDDDLRRRRAAAGKR